jgi:PmbA protein
MVKEKINVKKEEISINITNNYVDSIRFKNLDKTGFRVYDQGFIGISGIEGEYNEEEMFQQAIKNLQEKITYPGIPQKEEQITIQNQTVQTSNSEFIQEIEQLMSKLRKKYPDIIFSHKMNLVKQEQTLQNNQNLSLQYSDKYYELGLLMKEKTSPNLFDMFFEATTRNYNEAFILEDISTIIDNYKIKKDIETGLQNVIIDLNAFSGKIETDLSSTILMSGASLFSGKIGQKIFSDDVTLYNTKNPDEVLGCAFFDSEGVVNDQYRFTFVDHGTLVTPLVSKKEAIQYHLPITGTGESSYDSVPQAQATQFAIEKSQKTLKELLHGEKAIYVVMSEGGDFTPSGDYASPVQLAYLVEDGKITGRVDGLSIAGNIFDFLGKNYVGRAKDSFHKSSEFYPIVVKMNILK